MAGSTKGPSLTAWLGVKPEERQKSGGEDGEATPRNGQPGKASKRASSPGRPVQARSQPTVVIEVPSSKAASSTSKKRNHPGLPSESSLLSKKPAISVEPPVKVQTTANGLSKGTATSKESSAKKAKRVPLGQTAQKRKSLDVRVEDKRYKKQMRLSFGDQKTESATDNVEPMDVNEPETGKKEHKGKSKKRASAGKSAKASASSSVAPERTGKMEGKGFKQGHLAFAVKPVDPSSAVAGSSSSASKSIEVHIPTKPMILGKKPKKTMEDLAPEMLPFSHDLPKMKECPESSGDILEWRRLNIAESMSFAVVVKFMKTFAVEYLELTPDTGLEYELDAFERYIGEGSQYIKELTIIYTSLYSAVLWSTSAWDLTIGYRIGRLLASEPSQQRLGGAFLSTPLSHLPPPAHAACLHYLVGRVLSSEEFRNKIRESQDRLQEMRTSKWSIACEKKQMKEEHEKLEATAQATQAEIDKIEKELEELKKPEASDNASEDDSVTDELEGAGKTRALKRLVSRDRLAYKQREIKSLRGRQIFLVREATTIGNKITKLEKKYAAHEQEEKTWDARYHALEELVRARNCKLGEDRFGRHYWLLPIRSVPPPSASPPQDGETEIPTPEKILATRALQVVAAANEPGGNPAVYGIIVEALKYTYSDARLPPPAPSKVDRKGKGKAPANGEQADDYYTPPNNEAKRAMRVESSSRFWYLDSLASISKLFRACNDRGARERELRHALTASLAEIGCKLPGSSHQAIQVVFAGFENWMQKRGEALMELAANDEMTSESLSQLREKVKEVGTALKIKDSAASIDAIKPTREQDELAAFKTLLATWAAQHEQALIPVDQDSYADIEHVENLGGVVSLIAWCEDALIILRPVPPPESDPKQENGKSQSDEKIRKGKHISRELRALQLSTRAHPVSDSDTDAQHSRRRNADDDGDDHEHENRDPSSTHRTRSGRCVRETPHITQQISEADFDALLREVEGEEQDSVKTKKARGAEGSSGGPIVTRSGRLSKKGGMHPSPASDGQAAPDRRRGGSDQDEEEEEAGEDDLTRDEGQGGARLSALNKKGGTKNGSSKEKVGALFTPELTDEDEDNEEAANDSSESSSLSDPEVDDPSDSVVSGDATDEEEQASESEVEENEDEAEFTTEEQQRSDDDGDEEEEEPGSDYGSGYDSEGGEAIRASRQSKRVKTAEPAATPSRPTRQAAKSWSGRR